MVDVARLRALFASPDVSWIVDRLRARLARGAPLTGSLALRDPTDKQRDAVARLLGRRTAGGHTLTVNIGDLDALLRHGEICDGITEAVTLLAGPVENERALRDATEARWEHVFLNAAAGVAGRPSLERWLGDVRASGLLRRLADGDPDRAVLLIEQAVALADRLPARGVSLAELAAHVAGDSHALDSGEPLGTLALRLALRVGGDRLEPPTKPRDVWASVGVLCDELSAPVLVLNLAAAPSTPTGRALAIHAEAGEPYRLSVRQLLRDPPDVRSSNGVVIHVCENPSVVSAAANRLGAASAPLVCVEGQPRTGARLLLAHLARHGARLRYHGDFDWGGVHIGNVVIGALGAEPWRFTSTEYAATEGGRPLVGALVAAVWDAALAPAMAAAGRAVHEEHVMNALIADLSPSPRRFREP